MKLIKISAMWCPSCLIMNSRINKYLIDKNVEVIDYDYAFNDEVDVMTEYESYFRKLHTPIKRLIAKVGKKDEIK